MSFNKNRGFRNFDVEKLSSYGVEKDSGDESFLEESSSMKYELDDDENRDELVIRSPDEELDDRKLW